MPDFLRTLIKRWRAKHPGRWHDLHGMSQARQPRRKKPQEKP